MLHTCSGFFLVRTSSSLFGIVPPSHPIANDSRVVTGTRKKSSVETNYRSMNDFTSVGESTCGRQSTTKTTTTSTITIIILSGIWLIISLSSPTTSDQRPPVDPTVCSLQRSSTRNHDRGRISDAQLQLLFVSERRAGCDRRRWGRVVAARTVVCLQS